MYLHFVELDSLPPLAWGAVHRRDDLVVELLHGTGVETRPDRFVEGAWAGSFADFAFEDAFLAGSGGKVKQGKVHFVAPSHTLERLLGYQRQELTIVSNSIPFALALAEDGLDPDFVHYRNFFHSAVRNPATGIRTVPTLSGGRLSSFYRETIVLTRGGFESLLPPGSAREFQSFADYREYLTAQVGAIFENAAHPSRRRRYVPLASVSSGYDSGACAAISRVVGCREAITLRRPRGDGTLMDHGGETAAALGLTLIEADRGAYFQRHDYPEAVFLACGFGGEELTLAGFSPHVRGRVLVTGVHGDRIWTLDPKKVRDDIRRNTPASASLGEFRLREDFVHLPIALIGAASARSIWRISGSEEMKPWSVGGDYDRPIPRRILEEAGVPRDRFAARKFGYVGKLDPDGKSGYTSGSIIPLTPPSKEQFDLFCRRHLRATYRLTEIRARPLRALDRRIRARDDEVGLLPRALRFTTRLLLRHPPAHVLNVPYGRASLLPLWGIETVRQQYREMLKDVAATRPPDGAGTHGPPHRGERQQPEGPSLTALESP